MKRLLLPWLALAVLIAPAIRAQDDSTAPPPEEQPAAAAQPAEDPGPAASWKLCRVEVTTLFNSTQGSRIVGRDTGLLFQGENFDFSREIAIDAGARQALLRLRVRVRANVAREKGVIYGVTAETTLASAVGFSAADVGQEQVRNDDLAFDEDPSPRLFDVYSSPDLQGRLLLAMTARPIAPGEKVPGDELAGPQDVRNFRVEALLKQEGSYRVIQQAVLSAMPGRPASLSFGSLGIESKAPVDPAHRLGASVTVTDLGHLPDSGFGDGRTQQPAEKRDLTDYAKDNRVDWDDDFTRNHTVVIDDKDDPHHVTVMRKSPKMSNAKKRKLRALDEAEAARRMAQERERTQPASEDVPKGFEREQLILEIRPLHASRDHVQVEIGLSGRMKLPNEDEVTPFAGSFVEQLPVGEAYDISLAGLARGGEPDYDYVLRITPLL